MTAANVLTGLQNMGLTLESDGEKLTVTPKSAITDEARNLIRAHKDELLALLVPPSNDPPDLNTLANGLAKEFGVNPVQALELLDDDDRPMIQAGDQATIDAWRCAVESRIRRGEWAQKPPSLTVIAKTSEGRYSVDMAMPDGLPAPVKAITAALPKAAAVRFKLKDGEGGGVLIDPDGMESVHATLTQKYGDRLQEINP